MDELFAGEMDAGTFPGAELLVAHGDSILTHQVWGSLDADPKTPLTKGLVYDVASLTKPVATMAVISRLSDMSKLSFSDPVSTYLPGFYGDGREQITIGMLASHISGLPAHVRFYEICHSVQAAWDALLRVPLDAPPGHRMIYSCPGYLLLGRIAQLVTGKSLKNLFDELIGRPMCLGDTGFRPLEMGVAAERIVPTSRGDELRGIANDGNCRFFGGQTGNAGLFSTATDLLRFSTMLLNGGCVDGVSVLSQAVCALQFHNQNKGSSRLGLCEPRTFGWEYQGGGNETSCGPNVPVGAIGHTGFTGPSIWIEPQHQTVVIMLTNRVLLSKRGNLESMQKFRKRLHTLIFSELPSCGQKKEGGQA